MNRPTLTVSLKGKPEDDGKVRLDDFREFLHRLDQCLARIDSLVSGLDRRTTIYRISDLSTASAVIEVEAVPVPRRGDYAAQVVSSFVRGVKSLEEEGLRPPGFDRPLLEAFKELARPLRRHVQWIEVKSADIATRITHRTEENIEKIVGEDIVAQGSVSGQLDVVNVHGKNVFYVYPVADIGRTECSFTDDLFEKVKAGLRRRVSVTGTLRYKANEIQPYRIDVQDVEVFPPEDELPSLKEFRGAAPRITGSVDSVDFIRRLRDAG